jgi:hypothetical protein
MQEANIWVEDNQILCCSQQCEGCSEKYKCKPIPETLLKALLEVKHGDNCDRPGEC